MRKLLSLLLLALLAPPAPLARAGVGGSEGGGGGNDLIAEFVATANVLLDQVNFTKEDRVLLKKALANVQITSGPRLLNPLTGEPVPGQERLIAWGSPGHVQLKERLYINEASFEDSVAGPHPIAHIIIHELFRASGALDENGKSIDENFQLSIGRYKLDQNPTRALKRPLRAVQALYAECKITECKLRGEWYEGDEDLICRPRNEALNGYLGATLQLFRADSPSSFGQYEGTVSIVRWKSLGQRLGSQELLAVRVTDGLHEVRVFEDERNSLRDFRIGLSTKREAVSTGSLSINYSTITEDHFVDLTLGECRTDLK
jgi:hypothetical protein